MVAWLHLSDWHHRDAPKDKFDREVMLEQLLEDIENRSVINDELTNIDFILFSGDIAFSGAKIEFDQAKEQLIDPVRTLLGESVPIFFVPGNHDIERDRIGKISEDLRKQIAQTSLSDGEDFNRIVTTPPLVEQLNTPLSHYAEFISGFGCKFDSGKLYAVQKIKSGNVDIGIICINTAWNSARFNVQHADTGCVPGIAPSLWDYGLLRITEAQLRNAIRELGKVDLGILMMHHPLHWIDELERAKLEHMLFDHCHIVIHGHEHRPNTNQISSAFGDLVFIPAGATYLGRTPRDPRYTNSYNFTVVDTDNFYGTVHHRIWSEVNGQWRADERFWSDGRSQFVLARSKRYDRKLAHKSIANANKQYIGYIDKRVALDHEVILHHAPELVDGEPFIRQRIKMRSRLRSGPKEMYGFTVGVDDMILEHPNPAVRSRAYRFIGVSDQMKEVEGDKLINETRWEGILDTKEQWVEFEYEVLDLPSNFYYVIIARFTERVRLSLQPAAGYKYAYLPVGGFPSPPPSKGAFSVDTAGTHELILPSQGYIIQWRPEHKPPADPASVSASDASTGTNRGLG